ncbi:MAG TPA: hypothetical protein VGX48_14835 [Pyrinomonadaceae bacterium]|nr:hypothetical protein [Pyrinomonadaceae bacterium]
MKKFASIVWALAVAVTLASSIDTRAGVTDRLYDFTDEFYRQNGVDPAKIVGRRQPVAPLAVADTPYFPFQRYVRALLTLPAYNHSGSPVYWTVMGELNNDGFTDDEAGQRARQVADNMIEYVFPTRDGNPVGLGNLRQSVMLDMRNGYFSNNPLGLWTHVWVSYTERAFNTSEGRKTLEDLRKRNGLSLDGTPIIRTLSELDDLFSKGLAARRLRNPNGSEGAVYSICPVVKDPKNGGIAPDQFLAYTRKADGTPLEPFFLNNFNSLRLTGDWAK